jgi:hypothetical protein
MLTSKLIEEDFDEITDEEVFNAVNQESQNKSYTWAFAQNLMSWSAGLLFSGAKSTFNVVGSSYVVARYAPQVVRTVTAYAVPSAATPGINATVVAASTGIIVFRVGSYVIEGACSAILSVPKSLFFTAANNSAGGKNSKSRNETHKKHESLKPKHQ